MIPVPGERKQDGVRFRPAVQNGAQYETYDLFTSGIFHSVFWTVADHG